MAVEVVILHDKNIEYVSRMTCRKEEDLRKALENARSKGNVIHIAITVRDKD